jgi:Tfp pilus assembly PilM family ATPase
MGPPSGGSPFGAHGLTPTPGEGEPEGQAMEGPEVPMPPQSPEGGSAQAAGGPPPGEQSEPLWPEGAPDQEGAEKEEITRRALEITADALADEIRRSLDYYMSQEQSVPVSKLMISGGGVMLPNLDVYLSQIFPFPVELGNPLLRITQNKSDLTDAELQVLAPRLAIAIGLALEDEG